MIKKEVINGIRIIQEPIPFLPSCALGIIFNLGSRDENETNTGITHFIEHGFFKGTQKKTPKEISLYAESKGCHLDGFTTKESTGIYARFLKENIGPVLELLLEIATTPLFPKDELEKEKGVIYQEIREAEEDPEDKILSLLFSHFFSSHPLGRPITGTYEQVKDLTREKVLSYFSSNYTANNIILLLTGGTERLWEEVVSRVPKVKSLTNKINSPRRAPPPNSPSSPLLVEVRKELESAYIIYARPIFSYPPEKRYALSVLNTAFGSSLSSRLFQKLREEEGLVYQISSFVDLYSDSGLFGIYFITRKDWAIKALRIISAEREKVLTEGFSQKEIEVALNLTKSSIILSQESPLARMFALAKNELLLGRCFTLEETLSNYNRLKVSDVNSLLPEVLSPPFFVTALGDVPEKDLKQFVC